jgi:hypothetical protein
MPLTKPSAWGTVKKTMSSPMCRVSANHKVLQYEYEYEYENENKYEYEYEYPVLV